MGGKHSLGVAYTGVFAVLFRVGWTSVFSVCVICVFSTYPFFKTIDGVYETYSSHKLVIKVQNIPDGFVCPHRGRRVHTLD
jgi:hypothetical protein